MHQESSGVQPREAAHPRAQPRTDPEQCCRGTAPGLGLPRDTRVQCGVQPRYPGDYGDLALLEGAHELWSGQRVREDYGKAERKRREYPHHERIDVVKRQGHEHAVVLGHHIRPEYRVDLECQIGVAQWHAFGDAGGARGVEQGRRFVRIWARSVCIPVCSCQQMSPATRILFPHVKQDMPWYVPEVEALELLSLVGRGEDEPGIAVVQNAAERLLPDLYIHGRY